MACNVSPGVPAPHAPRFERVVNTAAPRELLGYSAKFSASELADAAAARSSAHAGRPKAALAADIENPYVRLADRLACGSVLAIAGDPRVAPLAPTMCEVPAADAPIGLAAAALPALHAALAPLGVAEAWLRKEVPAHTRRLRAFRIGRYPVTHLEYRAFLADSGEPRIPSSWRLGRFPWEHANHPVHGVRPEDADAYAAWLARRTGRPFRLPSEAEWEYAAAGPSALEYPWGETFNHARANTAELGLLCTTPVGAFPDGASWCGALDMAGNVEEFVSDAYAPYPGGESVIDDLWLRDPGHRVARGGSFARFHDLARTRRRHGAIFDNEVYVMGFRLAEDAA